MSAFPIGFVIALGITAFLHRLLPGLRTSAGGADSSPVSISLTAGLAISTLLLAAFQDVLPEGPRGPGQSIGPLALALLPLLVATLISDLKGPSSERHLFGLMGAGAILALMGFPIFIVTNPFVGTVDVSPLWQVLLTALWLVLLASTVELAGLVSAGAAVFGLAVAGVVYFSGGEQQTTASYVLAGIVSGAICGRILASATTGPRIPMGKSDLFALGLWMTGMTTAAFLKSVTLAAFVFPLSVLTLALITLGLRAFESSLLLRETPRKQ
jgi:hypothetical protein